MDVERGISLAPLRFISSADLPKLKRNRISRKGNLTSKGRGSEGATRATRKSARRR